MEFPMMSCVFLIKYSSNITTYSLCNMGITSSSTVSKYEYEDEVVPLHIVSHRNNTNPFAGMDEQFSYPNNQLQPRRFDDSSSSFSYQNDVYTQRGLTETCYKHENDVYKLSCMW